MSETQRLLREAEDKYGMLRMRLEATQRMVPESKEFTEELMHAYRKMGAAQDAEMATQKLLKKSEATASSLLNQLTSSRSTLDDMKQMMATKDDLLVTSTAQIGVLRKDIDSMHRTLLRREEEAKLLTSKSNLLAQETDTLKRERAKVELDLLSLRHNLKARDATISELNKAKNELQRTIDAFRSRSTHPSSKAIDSSYTTPTTTTSSSNVGGNQPLNAAANSTSSFATLRASAPPPSNGNNGKALPHATGHQRSHTSTDLSSQSHHDDGGGSSSDPHSHLYSTDGGDIFKLTDGDHNLNTSPPPEWTDPLSYTAHGASLKPDEIQRRIEQEYLSGTNGAGHNGAGQKEQAPGSLGRISPAPTAASGSSATGSSSKESAPISEKTKRSSTSSFSQLFAPFLPKSLSGGGSSNSSSNNNSSPSDASTNAANTAGRTQLSRSETPVSTHSPILTPPPAGSRPSTTSTYGPPSPVLHQTAPSVGGVGSLFSYTRTTPAPTYSATYSPQEVASMNQQHMRAIEQQNHHPSESSSSMSRIGSQSSPPAGNGMTRSPSTGGGTFWL